MSARKRKPRAIYRKPARVPATPEAFEAWARELTEPDPLGRALHEEAKTVRAYLATQGVAVAKRLPKAWPRPGVSSWRVDGGFICFRKVDHHPAVIEAVEALQAIMHVQSETGDRKVLAALSLGRALERLRLTAGLASALDSYERSHRPAVTDEQIRKAVASHKTRTAAAAALGITTRRLQDRCKLIGLPPKRNRKPTTSDVR
jgi:hypothetical protein